ncbi:failed axon connections homolog [Patella vulgata]|uniref:failed axon connections homolog n=1 Tax=Patella vulgata TaxID=6465 RepID=UPI0021804EE7|nr:failed axon connections homolog [Patella vulgata]
MKYSLEEVKELIHSHDPNNYLAIAGGVLAASALTYGLYKKITGNRRKKVIPKDVVIVHGCRRGPYCPSVSPFCLKVETYLRMNRIPYQSDKDIELSSKGKIPWIEYNGEVVNDSSFIIQYFNKKLDIDVDRDLTDKERAISRAFQKLIEENLFWCFALSRYVYGYTDNRWMGFGWRIYIPILIKRNTVKNAWAAGVGRHTQSEVEQIFDDDMKALSDFLSSKDFMMGSEPTEIDCTAFGMLAQFLWHSPQQPCETWIKEKYPNLQEYCIRMKDLFWEDWDECITHGGTREATR